MLYDFSLINNELLQYLDVNSHNLRKYSLAVRNAAVGNCCRQQLLVTTSWIQKSHPNLNSKKKTSVPIILQGISILLSYFIVKIENKLNGVYSLSVILISQNQAYLCRNLQNERKLC